MCGVKGFASTVSGPLGPWYRKVNAAVSAAERATTPAALEELLGPPDQREAVADDDHSPEDGPIDPAQPNQVWVYWDPYRPRRTYRFEIGGGRVRGRSRADLFAPPRR